MPKAEIREKLEDRNPKMVGLKQAQNGGSGVWVKLQISDFGFLSVLGFRPSDFCSAEQPSKSFYPQYTSRNHNTPVALIERLIAPPLGALTEML